MKMRALNHVNLVVSDPERSAAFYCELFGMERLWAEGDFIFLGCGDSDLALTKGKPLMHRRFHLGFRVATKQEVTDWLAEVTRYGAKVGHTLSDYGNYMTFSCLDPDGYALEIYYEEEPRGKTGDVGETE